MTNAPHRIIVTWEYDRSSHIGPANLTDLHPCNYEYSIAEWCIGNAEFGIRVHRYTMVGYPVSQNDISTMVDPYSADFLSSSHYYSRDNMLVEFLDLEFDNEDDLTLFKLAWVGCVKIVTEIPFTNY